MSIYATYTTGAESPLGIYSNQACTSPLSSITWGALTPGASSTVTLYVWNKANTAVTLTKSTANWNPSTLSNYLTLNWDYGGQTIPSNGTKKVTLTLSLAANTPYMSNFSFDTSITATG
jgi:hypothetical protein